MCGDPNMMKRAYVLPNNRKWIYWPHTINANSSSPIDGFSLLRHWGRSYYLGLSPARGWPLDCCCPLFSDGDRDENWYYPVPIADLIGIGLPAVPSSVPASYFPSHQSKIAPGGLFPNIFYQKDLSDGGSGTRRHQFGMIAYGVALDWTSTVQPTQLEMWIAIHERNWNIQFQNFSEEYFRANIIKVLYKHDLSNPNLHFFPCKMEGTTDFDYTIATDFRRIYYYRTGGGAETIDANDGVADPLYPALWSSLLSTCSFDWVESLWHRTACTYGCNA